MRVFFTTPYGGKAQYQPFIDSVLDVLHTNKAIVTTPEDTRRYHAALAKFEQEGFGAEGAHYAFISQGIADADVVVMEASFESFQVGHEATLALLYRKPTLVLSQQIDYSKYIPHELLFGKLYHTKDELIAAVQHFLDQADDLLKQAAQSGQTVGGGADSLHSAALAASRHGALHDMSEFGRWARLAEEDPEKAYHEIQKALGHLTAQDAWSVFAPVYNEDTPDYVFSGVANFVSSTFRKYGVSLTDPVADVATGTGAIARNLMGLGYKNLFAFDESREMLAAAYHLCAHLPNIKLLETSIADLKLAPPAKAMVWVDFSSNFALNAKTLHGWLQNLLANLASNGVLIFDVRTVTGWQVDFFHQKVTTFATPNFQRVWINLPDYENKTITFDVFIRTHRPDGTWNEWQREQLKEHMWSMAEVAEVVNSLPGCEVKGLFDDNFMPITPAGKEPGLAYFLLQKTQP